MGAAEPAGLLPGSDAEAAGVGHVPVRDAATVMLLRDRSAGGLEVCMLRRQHSSVFVAGMFVFPGGAVDPADRDPRWTERVAGLDAPGSAERLGSLEGGLAYWVAAVRESFEECGLLPAVRADGSPLRLDDPEEADRVAAYRAALDAGEVDLLTICQLEDLWVDASAMRYVGRRVTPKGAPRRYDARFFIAAAPAGQSVLHDGRETVESRWTTPQRALEEEAAGAIAMLPPTVAYLRLLAQFRSVEEALAVAPTLDRAGAPPAPEVGGEVDRT